MVSIVGPDTVGRQAVVVVRIEQHPNEDRKKVKQGSDEVGCWRSNGNERDGAAGRARLFQWS